MGKKGKGGGSNLGKALIRDRFGPLRNKRHVDSSMLHTSELDDGYDWGRLNLQSVTDQSSFQDFLFTAELAGTEFHAEKLNIKFVNPKSGVGLLTKDEKERMLDTQRKNKALLKIPRRPKWDSSTTAHELQDKEKEDFLEWRRSLAVLQEVEGLILTPYEKNLEFWRQLWRVVERSDVVVQIVDARNPLLFRCEDLEAYVKEVDSRKMNIILINKADLLTEEQRQEWAKYFTDINLRVAFFSATLAAEKQKIDTIEDEDSDEQNTESENDDVSDALYNKINTIEDENTEDENTESENSDASLYSSKFASESEYESADDGSIYGINDSKENKSENNECSLEELKSSIQEIEEKIVDENVNIKNSAELLSRDQLISFFRTLYKGETFTKGVTTIGLVGYPNVGKSSTINTLLMDKKVSVSATPGKTKHFQTLFLDKDLLLCDCPGLVMPSFICTKAEMILNGILPIDQMRDHVPPITLLGTLIPRHIIEDVYKIMIPLPPEGENPDRPPIAEEILNAYGYNRGFMTQNGQPDNPRSARYVLKDYVSGKLLYCVAPPTIEQEKFHVFPPREAVSVKKNFWTLPPRTIRATRGTKTTSEDVDKVFFQSNSSNVHVKGVIGKMHSMQCSNDTGSMIGSTQSLSVAEKPWKKINKHTNKKKREKTRRLYAHLDQH